MKIVLIAFFALFPATTFVYPSHFSMVVEHVRSFAVLVMFGLVLGVAALAFMVFLRRSAHG